MDGVPMTQDPSQALRAAAPLTRDFRQELRRTALRALERSSLQPWKLQTSNSFRRIGSHGDGDVLQAVLQRHDGQPDLLGAPGVLNYIVAAQPRVVLALLAALDGAEEPVQQGSHPEDVVSCDELRRAIACVRRCAESEEFVDKLRSALGKDLL